MRKIFNQICLLENGKLIVPWKFILSYRYCKWVNTQRTSVSAYGINDKNIKIALFEEMDLAIQPEHNSNNMWNTASIIIANDKNLINIWIEIEGYQYIELSRFDIIIKEKALPGFSGTGGSGIVTPGTGCNYDLDRDVFNNSIADIYSTADGSVISSVNMNIYNTASIDINSSTTKDVYSNVTKDVYSTTVKDVSSGVNMSVYNTASRAINSSVIKGIYNNASEDVFNVANRAIYSNADTNVYSNADTNVISNADGSVYNTAHGSVYSAANCSLIEAVLVIDSPLTDNSDTSSIILNNAGDDAACYCWGGLVGSNQMTNDIGCFFDEYLE